MMWGCLFPNARSTHVRRASTERGLAPFPLQAAGQQVGISAQPSLPTAQCQPAKLYRFLQGVPQRTLKGPVVWLPFREVTQCSTMLYSTLGYSKQVSHSTNPT